MLWQNLHESGDYNVPKTGSTKKIKKLELPTGLRHLKQSGKSKKKKKKKAQFVS